MLVTTGKDSLLSVKLQLGYRPCAMFFNLYHSLANSAEDKLIFFWGGGGGGGEKIGMDIPCLGEKFA